MNISGVARFAGLVTQDQVTAALQVLQQRHPALRVGIRTQKHAAEFHFPPDVGAVPLEWTETDDLDAWSTAALLLARAPFDGLRGPLARAHVLSNPQAGLTDIIIASHHAIADGHSRLQLFRELALACDGQELPPVQHTDLRPVPQVPRQHGFWRPVGGAVAHGWKQHRELSRSPLADPRPELRELESLRRRVWTVDGTARLREMARQQQTTLFGALVAAVVKTLAEFHQLQRFSAKICSPLDVRRYCDPPIEGEPVGCYAAMVDFTLLHVDQRSFWELARQAKQEIQRYLDTGLWAVGWRLLGTWLESGGRPQIQPVFCNLNNLGAIPPLHTRQLRLIEYSWAVNQRGLTSNLMLAAITIEGSLNLTLRSPWHSSAEADQILEGIVRRLTDAS